MSKIKMLCPFSGKLCEDCPVYRGRHYYLCFCENYRGHLDDVEENGGTASPLTSRLIMMSQFEIPSINPRNAIDPFAIAVKEID